MKNTMDEAMEITTCDLCGAINWFECESEWEGEDERGVGRFYYDGYAECLTCGKRQKLAGAYYVSE